MTGRLAGAVAAFLGILAGLWLVLAPFAIGGQEAGADWTHQTWTEVVTGGALALVGLLGVIAFTAALRQHLVDRGLVIPRQKHAPSAPPEPAPVLPPVETAYAPEQADPVDSDLKALLGPLVSALTQDLEGERRDGRQSPMAHYRREQAQ